MTVRERVPLAPRTSFGVGGPARLFAEAHGAFDLRELNEAARERALPLRLMGAGTNLLVPDTGVDALVAHLANADFAFETDKDGTELLVAGAGARWDDLVDAASARGLWGIENLAGIPGSAGGALVQNIGAYGAEFASSFKFAEVLDLATGEVTRIGPVEAELSYRSSIFKRRKDLAIVSVALALSAEGASDLTYADLARAKAEGVPLTSPTEIAHALRAIRARKFPAKGCAGSFFKNPIISDEALATLRARYPELPSYPAEGGAKIPLAWLLDRALGLAGYRRGPVQLFERQPLVIVAAEGARAEDIETLAREIENRMRDAFGITIEREVETFV